MRTVFRVVSVITQQLGHSVMCCSSLARTSASTDSSRYSFSSLRKSLHVSKGVVPLALEVAGKLLPQLQAGSQQPALDRGDGEVQGVGRLLGGKLVDVPQHENGPVRRIEALNGRIENAAEFLARVALLRVFVPGGEFAP